MSGQAGDTTYTKGKFRSLIAAGIAVAIIAAVFALGDDIKGFFEDVSAKLGSGGK